LVETGESRFYYEETQSWRNAMLSLIPKLSFFIFKIWNFRERFPQVFHVESQPAAQVRELGHLTK
jgi:hypothetical protein